MGTQTYSERHRDKVERTLALKELAYRSIGGLAVTLYWHAKSNSLSVLMQNPDQHPDITFPVESTDGLEAFYHPYPYAAHLGLLAVREGYGADDGA